MLYNQDLAKAENLARQAKKARVDALIVWDLAMVEIAKQLKIPFIISTQANVSNWKSALFGKNGSQKNCSSQRNEFKADKGVKEKS